MVDGQVGFAEEDCYARDGDDHGEKTSVCLRRIGWIDSRVRRCSEKLSTSSEGWSLWSGGICC